MSKIQKAWLAVCCKFNLDPDYNKVWQEMFEAGYQAAIADVKAGEPVAWHSPLRHGSHTTFAKPKPPPEWSDFYEDWFCTPLYKLPEDV